MTELSEYGYWISLYRCYVVCAIFLCIDDHVMRMIYVSYPPVLFFAACYVLFCPFLSRHVMSCSVLIIDFWLAEDEIVYTRMWEVVGELSANGGISLVSWSLFIDVWGGGVYWNLVLTIFNKGACLAFKSIFYKANNFSLTMKSPNPFLELNSARIMLGCPSVCLSNVS